MKRRVVVTGAGIVSCIGNDLNTVETSLREGRSGIQAMPLFAEMGYKVFRLSINWTVRKNNYE